MKRPSAFPVLVQVAALAVLALVLSQAVTFALVVLSPDPRPVGFSIDAASQALKGEAAETSDGRPLRRRITDQPVRRTDRDARDPVAIAIAGSLAERLGVPLERVKVSVERGPPRRNGPGPDGPPIRMRPAGDVNFVFVRPDEKTGVDVTHPAPAGAPSGEVQRLTVQRAERAGRVVVNSTVQQFTIRADRLTFAPFTASVQQDDGRWATVEPPRGLLSPWQKRVLLALGISVLLLAPLVWWMAQRLTRPIRVFAGAAERLGADPEAEPLKPSGPSEVRTAIHAFNDMQASLRNHMRQRTQTVAAIAHDLRTPLTRLRFRAEQAPDAVRDRMVADIEEMDALIAQAMAFVRGETTPERSEPLDLGALAADCAAGFAETGADVAFEGGTRLDVLADPAALRRALGNLIGNAVKYGGGARVKAFALEEAAVITVEDDGPGLPAHELEAVFEPFRRGEQSRNRETGGAGLGLTVARQAARGAGGEVTLSNRSGGGLTARLSLPLTRT
ncbi:ATP-binding protein [Brevundimonas sp. FT23028]|uniref:ATP-binding protein n=1 Tax=Brevundimonas sp. FT23028 TaxID=3393748 RepID=UPI003B588066